MYVCVCVCMCVLGSDKRKTIDSVTNKRIYIYVWACVCVCVYERVVARILVELANSETLCFLCHLL